MDSPIIFEVLISYLVEFTKYLATVLLKILPKVLKPVKIRLVYIFVVSLFSLGSGFGAYYFSFARKSLHKEKIIYEKDTIIRKVVIYASRPAPEPSNRQKIQKIITEAKHEQGDQNIYRRDIEAYRLLPVKNQVIDTDITDIRHKIQLLDTLFIHLKFRL